MDQQSQETSRSGFYLDTNHPIECDGMLTNWTVCYYRNPFSTRNYQIDLQTWRKNTSSDQYSMVGTSMIAVDGVSSQELAFNCRSYSLAVTDYIPVKQGDVVGAYLELNTQGFFDTVLRVLGSRSDQDSLHFTDQMPSNTLLLSDLAPQASVRIHISAGIGM